MAINIYFMKQKLIVINLALLGLIVKAWLALAVIHHAQHAQVQVLPA
jgi:hypothetical protein